MNVGRYRARVFVEAVQYDGANATEIIDWIAGPPPVHFLPAYTDSSGALHVAVPDEDLHANPGDWVIRGVTGKFFVRNAEHFARTYEEMTGA